MAYLRRRLSQSAGGRNLEARAQKPAGQVTKYKTAGKKCMGLRVITAIELVSAELKGVLTADQGDIVGELITPHDGKAGDKYLVADIGKAGYIESHLSKDIWVHVKVGIIPLDMRLIESARAELMKP